MAQTFLLFITLQVYKLLNNVEILIIPPYQIYHPSNQHVNCQKGRKNNLFLFNHKQIAYKQEAAKSAKVYYGSNNDCKICNNKKEQEQVAVTCWLVCLQDDYMENYGKQWD